MASRAPEDSHGGTGLPQGSAAFPVLDRQVLEELRQYSDDEQDLVQELVQIFLADSPMQLLALQDALRDQNWVEVERHSHRLKGSAGSLGGIRLRQLCEAIEQHARQHDIDAPEETAAVICQELQVLKQELVASLDQPAGETADSE